MNALSPLLIPLAVCLLSPMETAAQAWRRGAAEPVEKNTRRERFAVTPAQPLKVVVDNVFGSIHVTGGEGGSVEAVISERWYATGPGALAEARREVKLDARQEGGRVTFFADGPFRCGGECRCDCNHRRDYEVVFDFELKVPRDAELILKTVNRGDITVENVTGGFDVRNVNGTVTLSGLASAGSARTVNGKLSAAFERMPAAATELRTVNGAVRVELPEPANADLRLKTLNGSPYTDFEHQVLRGPVAAPERRGGQFVYRADRSARIRIGSGGPEFQLETVNGDILIRKRGNRQ